MIKKSPKWSISCFIVLWRRQKFVLCFHAFYYWFWKLLEVSGRSSHSIQWLKLNFLALQKSIDFFKKYPSNDQLLRCFELWRARKTYKIFWGPEAPRPPATCGRILSSLAPTPPTQSTKISRIKIKHSKNLPKNQKNLQKSFPEINSCFDWRRQLLQPYNLIWLDPSFLGVF